MEFKSSAGFTALELVLAIAIIAIIIAAAVTVITPFQHRGDLDIAALFEINALRRVQELARAGEGDARWGVKLATGTITVFRGQSFATRDSAYDETLDIAADITVGGTGEFVFTRMYATTTAGTTTLYHTILGESRSINVNTKGTANY